VEEILNASAEIDAKLDSQIKQIQEIRKQTEDALSASEGVNETYHSAQKQFKESIQHKIIEHHTHLIGSQRKQPKRDSVTPVKDDDREVASFLSRSGSKQGFKTTVQPERRALPFLVRPNV